jgi:hypothetical protein
VVGYRDTALCVDRDAQAHARKDVWYSAKHSVPFVRGGKGVVGRISLYLGHSASDNQLSQSLAWALAGPEQMCGSTVMW